MNPFESGARKAIPAVLIYARRPDGRVLMMHRGGQKAGDYHLGKWNGLGGKLEVDESSAEAARREFREESGIDLPLENFHPIGFLHFPNFKAHKSEDWIVTVFTASVSDDQSAGLLAEGAEQAEGAIEGSLHWIPADEILKLNLWAGDKLFIPHVLANQPFHGTIWYRGQEVVRHSVRPLG